MNRLENKVVLITGGSGNIGATAAKMFVNEGAKVMLVDINEDALKETVKDIGKETSAYVVADVSDEQQAKKYVDETIKKFGTIDVFLDNAGIEGKVSPLDEYPLDEFNRVIDINVKGIYYGLRHVFPHMKKNGGSIVITSSVAGLQGTPNILPYVTSKHAVIGMMKSAALEGAPHKIRVNTINPSPVDNRMMRSLEEGFAPGKANNAKTSFEQSIPLGRYATNEEVAKLMLFLAGDDSEFITGTVNPIDGGMTV
ncbi:SDR family NAD(P)-dependent oxidoreductase [Prolixibacter sp. SD074]|jgi:NAD(P)-dependent dehydrogenase (short-subunit alcohol dehydrogenase family)|uniref:SDR family NAD(P)-dependent oxidoreductase n=1 Tax=Prolixibacter sp. SD074 TaxID=2652391 RepID=UPI0012779CF1|nr:SDR family oxidoreductase [Prolixibacter sp. SD074]GET29292.1 short chain dehydrogenase [Prolixibacter sp. SD074]